MDQHRPCKTLFIRICNQDIITYVLRLKPLRMELSPVPILIVSRSMPEITTQVVRRTSACILTALVLDSSFRIFPREQPVQQITIGALEMETLPRRKILSMYLQPLAGLRFA